MIWLVSANFRISTNCLKGIQLRPGQITSVLDNAAIERRFVPIKCQRS